MAKKPGKKKSKLIDELLTTSDPQKRKEIAKKRKTLMK